MLRFDDVPDIVEKVDFGGGPNAGDAQFSSPDGFVLWPAHEGPRRVNVKISTRGLSRLAGVPFGVNAGVPFGVNNARTIAALQTHRVYLERRAIDEFIEGASGVVLDEGSLYPVRSPR